jgi:hypothetical protein
MSRLLAVATLLLLAGCATSPKLPNVPREVTVAVKEYRHLPPELLRPVAKPVASDGSLGALNRTFGQRGDVIDLLNCRLALLAQIDDGGAADPHACDGTP